MAGFKVLVFDLGGVLLRLNSPRQTFDLQINENEFLERWIHSLSVREFERGAIDAESFAKSIVIEAKLPYDWHEFLKKFDAWPDQLYPGITDLLDSIPSTYPCALLSNTNAIHWQRDGIASELEHRFEEVFLSYITGRLKPDSDAYRMVQMELGCESNQIIFFDDNPANVQAATECGWMAVLTKGIDELRKSLDQLGVTTGRELAPPP